MPYDTGSPENGNWFEQSDVDAANAKAAALMDQFRNRGPAPEGWQWQSQFTPANNSLFGEDSVQGDQGTPYRVLQENGDAGSWWAGGGSPMNYADYDPTTKQFSNDQHDAGSGWSYRDLTKIAAMAAAGGALSGTETGTTMGDGAFLGEGVASGVPAWDAAATDAGLSLSTGAEEAFNPEGYTGSNPDAQPYPGEPGFNPGFANKAIDFLTNPKNFSNLMQSGGQAAGNNPFGGVPGDNGRAMAEALRKKGSMEQQGFNPSFIQP